MQITVKDVNGLQLTIEMLPTDTIAQLLTKVRETHECKNCLCVVDGAVIAECTELHEIKCIRLTVSLSEIPTCVYNGTQILKALKGHHFTMIYLLNYLAQSNPYILSYLAQDPNMVRDYIEQQLSKPSFEIKVKKYNNPFQLAIEKYDADTSELVDELFEGQEAESNPYVVDQINVNRLLQCSSLPPSEFQSVKDIYLFMDRNFDSTLDYLKRGLPRPHGGNV